MAIAHGRRTPGRAALAGWVALLLAAAAPAPGRSLAFVPESWVYVLQPRQGEDAGDRRYVMDPCRSFLLGVDATPTDVAVIDPECVEGDRAFSRDEVEELKSQPDSRRRIVLAYLSIGEAEDYRFYWRSSYRPARRVLGFHREGNPSWLGRENPRWEGNYRVRFWDTAWQRILLDGPFMGPGGARIPSAMERILAAGFDGVYLDLVDAYEGWLDERPTARREMVDLVERIRRFGDQRFRVPEGGARPHPGFQVVAQNAAELLTHPEVGARYRRLVSGVGVEELYFLAHDERRDPEETRAMESQLTTLREQGGYVLTVDYARRSRNVREAYRRSRGRGFVPYVTDAELDRVTAPPEDVGWRARPVHILPVDMEEPAPSKEAADPSAEKAGDAKGSTAVAATVTQSVLKGTTPGALPAAVTLAAVMGVTLGPVAGVVGAAAGVGIAKGVQALWERFRGQDEEGRETDPAPPDPDPLLEDAPPPEEGAAPSVQDAHLAYQEAAEDLRGALDGGTSAERSAAWVRYRAAWGDYVRRVQGDAR